MYKLHTGKTSEPSLNYLKYLITNHKFLLHHCPRPAASHNNPRETNKNSVKTESIKLFLCIIQSNNNTISITFSKLKFTKISEIKIKECFRGMQLHVDSIN
jgi:hypothetical protein